MKFNYRWAVISDQLMGEYAVVTQHGFEDVAMRDSGTIAQGERRDWVIDTGQLSDALTAACCVRSEAWDKALYQL